MSSSRLLTAEQNSQLKAGTHYVCARCGGFFGKLWSEEEARAESKGLWGDLPADDVAVICDGCFKRFKAWTDSEGIT